MDKTSEQRSAYMASFVIQELKEETDRRVLLKNPLLPQPFDIAIKFLENFNFQAAFYDLTTIWCYYHCWAPQDTPPMTKEGKERHSVALLFKINFEKLKKDPMNERRDEY